MTVRHREHQEPPMRLALPIRAGSVGTLDSVTAEGGPIGCCHGIEMQTGRKSLPLAPKGPSQPRAPGKASLSSGLSQMVRQAPGGRRPSRLGIAAMAVPWSTAPALGRKRLCSGAPKASQRAHGKPGATWGSPLGKVAQGPSTRVMAGTRPWSIKLVAA